MSDLPDLHHPGKLALYHRGTWTVYDEGDADRPRPRVVYPGAFQPLHDGHRRIAEIASARLVAPVHFEISLANVDKPDLSSHDLVQRISQFPADAAIWATRAASFAEKSRLFPGAVFLVGADTLIRILDLRYYGDDALAQGAAIREIASQGCRFLVFGRQVGKRFWTLADIAVPDDLHQRCEGVALEDFRMDVSSTALRRRPTNRRDS